MSDEDRLREATELLEWFWDSVSPEDRTFKSWDDKAWTWLCEFLGKPPWLLDTPDPRTER